MYINSTSQLDKVPVYAENAEGVSMQIIIGEKHGSSNITIRNFTIAPGGYSLHHQHNYEHLVQVTKGHGIFLDNDGMEHEITVGNNIFIPCNEMHQFLNRSNEELEFTCTILNKINNF
jgi:quercetin dioxygenase-like cupin family protein